MNIAIISSEFPPITNWGGIATFNSELASLLSANGHNVYVFTLDNNLKRSRIVTKDGYKIVYITYKTNNLVLKILNKLITRILSTYLPKFAQFLIWNINFLIVYLRFVKKNKIEVVHTPSYQSPTLLLYLVVRKTKIISHMQGPQIFFSKYEGLLIDNYVVGLIEKLSLLKFSTVVVSCSKYMSKLIINKYPNLNLKLVTIPNFINIGKPDNKLPNTNNIVYWGRLEMRKGIDLVLKSFCEICKLDKKTQLYLIGKRVEEDGLSHKNGFENIFRLNIKDKSIINRIHVIPYIFDKSELNRILIKHKGIAIFPARYEPFGFTIIEAMNLGYLVISSKNVGSSNIIKNGVNGYISKLEINSVVSNIYKFKSMTKPEIRNQIKLARKSVYNEFNLDKIYSEYNTVYKNIINHDKKL